MIKHKTKEPRPLILASKSPVRKSILCQAGVPLVVQKPKTEEDIFKKQHRGKPEELSLFLASKKALDVSITEPSRWVLGADQVCLFQGRALGKPSNIAHAQKRLMMLRNKTHTLCCGVALAYDGIIQWQEQHDVFITMNAFTNAFLTRYITNNSTIVTSCAGGYALEGEGIQMISSIKGDFFSAFGLPLLPILAAMRRYKILLH